MRAHWMLSVAGVALGLVCLFGARPVAAQHRPSMDDVAFLAGCWAGGSGTVQFREQWSEAEAGVMLGTTRFIRDGALVDYEFQRLVATSEGVVLWPYPRGTISEHGFPLVSADADLVFENLEHDFPVRIIYERLGPDHLRPRIEGRDGQGPGWEVRRVPCPSG